MIKKYKKKPVIIEAVQFTGGNINEMLDFAENEKNIGYDAELNRFYVKTLEGKMYVSLGDYIIKGVKGEFYPCKPDIFEETYEEVSEVSNE